MPLGRSRAVRLTIPGAGGGPMGSLAPMSDWRTETAARMRALILAADSDITEETKWVKPSNPDGVPTFVCEGIVCTLETYRDKVKLTFAKGASLEDPQQVFNASLTAGTRRALDLHEGDEVDESAFSALVVAAVAANRA